MTDDQIIEMAKRLGWNVEHTQTNRMLVLFAREIAAFEREECAVIANNRILSDSRKAAREGHYEACKNIAANIRARGQA